MAGLLAALGAICGDADVGAAAPVSAGTEELDASAEDEGTLSMTGSGSDSTSMSVGGNGEGQGSQVPLMIFEVVIIPVLRFDHLAFYL